MFTTGGRRGAQKGASSTSRDESAALESRARGGRAKEGVTISPSPAVILGNGDNKTRCRGIGGTISETVVCPGAVWRRVRPDILVHSELGVVSCPFMDLFRIPQHRHPGAASCRWRLRLRG